MSSSISPQNHVVFDDMVSTLESNAAIYPEVWISLVVSWNSRVQAMLYQEDDPDLDEIG